MDLLLLTSEAAPADVLPALDLLPVAVTPAALQAASLVTADRYDLVLLDARVDLAAARALGRLLGGDGLGLPVLAVLTEGGMAVVGPDWGVADVVLTGAGPAEVHGRLRMLLGRAAAAGNSGVVTVGELTVEEDTYAARLRGRPLELTYKEFELLKYLAQHPGRVFTREQLVAEVWGYDFFGGTRTVDVHVRRLRAKLGPEHEALIGTVRHVGYKLVPPSRQPARDGRSQPGSRREWMPVMPSGAVMPSGPVMSPGPVMPSGAVASAGPVVPPGAEPGARAGLRAGVQPDRAVPRR